MVKCGGLRILGKLVYVCWFRSGHVGRFDKGGLVSSLRRIGGRVGFTNRLSFRSKELWLLLNLRTGINVAF